MVDSPHIRSQSSALSLIPVMRLADSGGRGSVRPRRHHELNILHLYKSQSSLAGIITQTQRLVKQTNEIHQD